MEATSTQLNKHAQSVNSVLQIVCDVPDPMPLVQLSDGTITLARSCPPALSREVTSDLGVRETAMRLPTLPPTENPRFWIAMHELWEFKGRHKVRFVQCGLRLYMGDRSEQPVQFLRLEWVAPDVEADGEQNYHGKYAGHPHWHIDSSALLNQEEHFRLLEALTSPSATVKVEPEEFGSEVLEPPPAALLDFSWLQTIHLPARAHWMQSEWDGRTVPGPHQCEPENPEQLTRWWAGAIRYCASELSRQT